MQAEKKEREVEGGGRGRREENHGSVEGGEEAAEEEEEEGEAAAAVAVRLATLRTSRRKRSSGKGEPYWSANVRRLCLLFSAIFTSLASFCGSG